MADATPSVIDVQALQQEVAELCLLLSLRQAPTEPGFKVKVADPPTFNGQHKKDAQTFLAHLKLNFSANPSSFPTDTSKIVYAASWLRDKAFEWFEPMLRSGAANSLTWLEFERVFLHSHGDPDHKRHISTELLSLTQTGAAATYATRFFQLSSQLHWNDEALRARFYEGLREDVKDALAYTDKESTDVHDLANLVVKLDNRLYERRKSSRQRGSSETPAKQHRNQSKGQQYHHQQPQTHQAHQRGVSASNSSSSSSGPAPMDLDASAAQYQPLTEDEKNRRRKEGLCLYCGTAGHIAEKCPKKRKRNNRPVARAAAVSFSLGPPGPSAASALPALANVVAGAGNAPAQTATRPAA